MDGRLRSARPCLRRTLLTGVALLSRNRVSELPDSPILSMHPQQLMFRHGVQRAARNFAGDTPPAFQHHHAAARSAVSPWRKRLCPGNVTTRGSPEPLRGNRGTPAGPHVLTRSNNKASVPNIRLSLENISAETRSSVATSSKEVSNDHRIACFAPNSRGVIRHYARRASAHLTSCRQHSGDHAR